MNDYEIRTIAPAELRAVDDNGIRKLTGHAAVFNSFSEDLGGFREIIRPGAFTRALAEKQDVRALVDHDASRILGRARANTLRLREDKRGLFYEVDLPDTGAGRDIWESVRRGDVSGSSFAFRAKKDNWRHENEMGDIRELYDVDLFDVSPVTSPAYPAADVAVRSYQQWKAQRVEQTIIDELAKRRAERMARLLR